jgi:hypothetical protein
MMTLSEDEDEMSQRSKNILKRNKGGRCGKNKKRCLVPELETPVVISAPTFENQTTHLGHFSTECSKMKSLANGRLCSRSWVLGQ